MQFEEFQLSKSNAQLAKKTVIEYLNNKENACANNFKAKPFDKNALNQKSATKSPTESAGGNSVAPRITECSPFNFKTEERLKLRQVDTNGNGGSSTQQ